MHLVKNKFLIIYTLCLVTSVILQSCSNTQHITSQNSSSVIMPTLGSIGVEQTPRFKQGHFQMVGTPVLTHKIKLSVSRVPFNKHTSKLYNSYIQRVNSVGSISFNDTLAMRPKFFKIDVVDRIGFTDILNFNKNSSIYSYLLNDDKYSLVTSLLFTVIDSKVPFWRNIKEAYLVTDENGQLLIEVIVNTGKKQIIHFSEMETFGYELSSFCWGVNNRFQPEIKALINFGEKCKKPLQKNAQKIDTERSFLKL